MRKVILVAAAFCLLLLVPAATAKSVNVDLSKLGFVPSAAAVQVGDTVIWTNKDTDNHQVVCKACPFTSPVLKPGDDYSYQFTKVGKFATVDPLNKNKKGTVTVKAVAAALTLSATPATVTYGASTNSSGTLSTQQAGQKVEILAQECSQNNSHVVATIDTASGGAFTYQARPTKNTSYQARSKPVAGAAVLSPAVTVKVRPKVKLSKVARGKFSVRLAAADSFVGKVVVFQRYNKALSKWVTLKTVTLRTVVASSLPLPGTTVSSATFKVKVKLHVRVRAVLPPAQAAPCYLAARSNLIYS